jgi:hypothetical protein
MGERDWYTGIPITPASLNLLLSDIGLLVVLFFVDGGQYFTHHLLAVDHLGEVAFAV